MANHKTVEDCELLYNSLDPVIKIYTELFRSTADPELKSLLNDLTPTLISVKIRVYMFQNIKALRISAFDESTDRKTG